MLRELVRKELLSREPIEISNEVLDSIVKYIVESFWWCLSRLEVDVCRSYEEVVSDVIKSLGKVRIQKFIDSNFNVSSASFDGNVLRKFISELIRYYSLSFRGLIDSDGSVMVRVLKDFIIEGKDYNRGSVVPLNVVKALALEILGLIEIID